MSKRGQKVRLLVLVALAAALTAVSVSGGRIMQPLAQAAPVPAPAVHTPPELLPGANPLTGLALPEQNEQTQQTAYYRPLAVMVDNVHAAMPQRGIGVADIVCEILTEGGVTRLMALYSDYTSMPEVGPVRSARDQHLQLALPMDALILHVGGSTYAADLLEIYHYSTRTLNSLYQTEALRLDSDRSASLSAEHCWFTSGALFSAAAERYALDTQAAAPVAAFSFVPYTQSARVLQGEAAAHAYLRFSSYANTDLYYDALSARYQKYQFGAPQIDENTGETLAFDNVLVLFAGIDKYPDGVLSRVDYSGGTGYYLCGGRCEALRWEKGLTESALALYNANGEALRINPGVTYLAVVGTDMQPYFTLDFHARPR